MEEDKIQDVLDKLDGIVCMLCKNSVGVHKLGQVKEGRGVYLCEHCLEKFRVNYWNKKTKKNI